MVFRGLQFSHATWLQPSTGEGLSEIQATYSITGANGYRTQGLCGQYPGGTCPFGAWAKTPGNVSFRYAHGIRLIDGAFAHLGGAGLDLDDGAQDITVSGCTFTDISGTGVHIGDVDKPQATGADVTSHIDVRNNHLYALPVEFHGGVAIFNGYTHHTTIANNQIDHTAYTGISTGWGGWLDKVRKPGQPNLSGSNRIAKNLIFDHMMVLSDGAGIYNNGVAGPSLSGGLRIAGNVIRDQRGPGHGIYLDNGSYGITADGNVLIGNPHDWAGLRKNNNANDGSYSPMDIRGNYWQQGDPDRTVTGATIRGNRITATLSDAPASVVQGAGLEPEHRDILQRRFAAPAAPDPPERVAAFAGDRFAYVSWLSPVVDGGAEVTSYTVTASTGRRITVPAADFGRLGYVKVTGLTNGTPTIFTVTANNANGTGPASLASAPVTPNANPVGKPGAPATAVAHPGNGTAAVLFTPPAADGGSPVVAYRITGGASTVTLTGRLLISGKRNVPVVLTGLTNGKSYVIEVAAVNAAGTGPVTRSTPVTPSP
jgi:Right handed beta helix region/Fibronectin type III domain